MTDLIGKRIVDALLTYVNEGRVAETLSVANSKMTAEDLRIVAIKILSWLKAQNRARTDMPLAVNADYRWCQNLAKWLAEDREASSVFVTSDDGLSLHPGIGSAVKRELLKQADERYRPKLMTSITKRL